MRRAADLLLSVVFCAALAAPFADQLVRPSSARDSKVEFRAPAPMPKRPDTLEKLEAWPAAYEAWYLDHFGLRDVFLHWNSLVLWFGVGVSPTRKFVRGEDGWIFQTDFRALDDHRGAHGLTHGQLEAWRRFLEGRRDALRERGIDFLYAIAPHKSALYPELVPERFAVRGPTRAEQLEAYLERTSDVRILDLRGVLREAKKQDAPGDPLYHPLGTHWTGRGDRVAYGGLAAEIARRFPSFHPLTDADFDVAPDPGPGDSWAGRMYLEGWLVQKSVAWTLRMRHARHLTNCASPDPFRSERDDPSLPKAVFFHDSFGMPQRALLAEGFSRLACVWSGDLVPGVIDEEKPDLVIQMLTEQNFQKATPQLQPEEDRGARERRFLASDRVLWRYEPARFPDGLVADGKSRMRIEEGAVVLERRAGSDVLLLPEFACPSGADLLVRIDLERAREGEARLFYTTRQDKEYGADRSAGSRTPAGRSVVVHEVPEDDFQGRLAWSAGGEIEPIRIRSIEVRAAWPSR